MTAVVLLKRLNTTEIWNTPSVQLLRNDMKVEEGSSSETDNSSMDGFESHARKSEYNFNQAGSSAKGLIEATKRNDTERSENAIFTNQQRVNDFSSGKVSILFHLKN